MTIEQVALADLILPMELYPRRTSASPVDDTTVGRYVESIRAGQRLPPPKVWKSRLWVADGWHRVYSWRRVNADAEIEVEMYEYASEGEFFRDAARLNHGHGRPLSAQNRIDCYRRLREFGYEAEVAADSVGWTVDKAERFVETRLSGNEDPEILKAPLRHLAGESLTPKERRSARHAGGNNLSFYVNQIILYIEGDIVDTHNNNLMDKLGQLHRLLDEWLGVHT